MTRLGTGQWSAVSLLLVVWCRAAVVVGLTEERERERVGGDARVLDGACEAGWLLAMYHLERPGLCVIAHWRTAQCALGTSQITDANMAHLFPS